MSYECLSTPSKRAEYDEYLTSHLAVAGYQRRFEHDGESESDSEEEEFTKNRSEDRAKRRFEERDDFYNQAFMNNFKSRSRKHRDDFDTEKFTEAQKEASKEYNKGKDIKIEVDVTFHEAVKGTIKGVIIHRKTTCQECGGSRAENEDEIFNCFS